MAFAHTSNPATPGRWLTALACGLALACLGAPAWAANEGVASDAGPMGPAQIVYAGAKGPGPVVIVISGQSGPNAYKSYASRLADLGYYTVLLTGKDILNPERSGELNLRAAVDRAMQSPDALKGKAAVIGFSLGGGGALYNAAPQKDIVSMVVAYYPYTRTWAQNMDSLAKRFKVPVLVLPAALDRYHDCCVIESMQAMQAAASRLGASFEMVVYPQANHGFNLATGARGEPVGAYRADDDADAWNRTVQMLQRYQPLP